ncbi:hypothetical protein ONZ43_g6995 [Nemania bipapillata]|uniref:Uncharacterized protein n=1 Tax=Nemania bipapillata TaxID=110536 RepID=A0ACC2HUP5_9PEZI|nr:hypothetical protein ONZ43_g6995 [Nemania bipapillata]
MSGTESDAVLGAYDQAANIPPELSSSFNRMGLSQPSSSVEFQGHYVGREASSARHPNIAFASHHAHGSGAGAGLHAAMLGPSEMLDSSVAMAGYGDMTSIQAPGLDVDSHETLSQPFQTPYAYAVDLKAYDFMTTPFSDPPH